VWKSSYVSIVTWGFLPRATASPLPPSGCKLVVSIYNPFGRDRDSPLLHQCNTTGGWLFAVCQKHTAKAFLHTAKPLPCVAHGKRQTANRRRQRSFQKTDFKNRKQKRFNSGRTPPASHTPVPSKLQVVTFFAHHAAGKIRTHNLSLTCNLLYNYTIQSLVSILHFLSPHIILNWEYIVCLRP